MKSRSIEWVLWKEKPYRLILVLCLTDDFLGVVNAFRVDRRNDEKELAEVRALLSEGPAARPLQKNAGPVERLKHSLCAEFVKYKNQKALSQKELASELGVDEALVSKIINYAYEEFTVDRLVKYLAVLYPKVDFSLRVA